IGVWGGILDKCRDLLGSRRQADEIVIRSANEFFTAHGTVGLQSQWLVPGGDELIDGGTDPGRIAGRRRRDSLQSAKRPEIASLLEIDDTLGGHRRGALPRINRAAVNPPGEIGDDILRQL